MTQSRVLANLLDESVRSQPNKVAIVVPNAERVTYERLGNLSDRLRDRLCALGVGPGDRVALLLHKSAAAVAAIFGVLKAGAAYVPIDADGPVSRAEYIIDHCRVKAIIADRGLDADLQSRLRERGTLPILLTLEEGSSADSLDRLLDSLQKIEPAPATASARPALSDVAYILYTSGSTGNPKGVTLTHGNALSFIDWCSVTFAVRPEDRFSSHAPFHFDLSILDIYVAIKHGCTLVLFDEVLGKQVMRLAEAIAAEKITVWYSTPSILSMLATYGKLHLHDHASLRLVLFAGEVFPISQYLSLRKFWPNPRCFNLYGPTETNVCTWYELPRDEEVAQMASMPIGHMCLPNRGVLVDEKDNPVDTGQGELVVSGPNVMRGYWNLPEKNAVAFMTDSNQTKWYRTGDIVVKDPQAGFIYVGRRDRMVKRRGYRIELGEIEAALHRIDFIQEAAVVAQRDAESGVRIAAFVVRGSSQRSLSEMKAASLRALPRYMIPDEFFSVERLPRTSTDKVDYEELKRSVAAAGHASGMAQSG
jgi:amino acid adenylation domain-containing protein